MSSRILLVSILNQHFIKDAHQLEFVVKSLIVIDKNEQNLIFQSSEQSYFSLLLFFSFFIDYLEWTSLIVNVTTCFQLDLGWKIRKVTFYAKNNIFWLLNLEEK